MVQLTERKNVVKARLIIHYASGFQREFKINPLSMEEIIITNGKNEYEKKKLYTGVQPRLQGRVGNRKLVYYARYGQPFTYDPYTGKIFSDEKKRALLIERNVGYPLKLGDQEIVIILDHTKDVPTPLWKPEKKEEYEGITFESLNDLKDWVDKNEDTILDMDIAIIPAFTEFDVSAIDMMREENAELCKSEAIKTTLMEMKNIGDQKNLLWYFVTLAITSILTTFLFLLFADQGVFS